MRIFLLTFFCLISLSVRAQRAYWAGQNDFIFSLAQMNKTSVPSSPVLRFSGFLNYELQLHYNFGKSVGMYSGFGIKNIGLINHFEYHLINIKQRAYALSIPLALKFGSMSNQNYIAVGGELDLMAQYKQKFIYGHTKIKENEWFSDKVNLLNPAVFLTARFMQNQVITVKYFLNDFLHYQAGGLTLPDGTVIPDYGRSSHLFYISWGTNIAFRPPSVKATKESRMRSASL
ncbi:MAG TPA: hypothetical protein VNB90_01345 [Cytophagaceae bacterium]|nr:hypothetical protein [Cytophagaceae bacterium]